MLAFYIIIPIMVLAVVVAVVPVLLGSFRHNRAMREGQFETAESANEEAAFWGRMLGRRHGSRPVKTPELLTDDEITRVSANPEDRIRVEGESVWSPPR
jgi:hypothetical protein